MEEQSSLSSSQASASALRPKSRLIKIIIGIFIIAALGAGIALATKAWNPRWNPFRDKSEKAIGEMMQRMGKLEALSYEAKASFKSKDKKTGTESELLLDFAVNSDKTDSKNPKWTTEMNGSFMTEGMHLYFDLETIGIGETAYIKMTTIPAILQLPFAFLGINLDEAKNQWIKIDKDSAKNLQKSFGMEIISEGEPGEEEYEETGKEAEKKIKAFLRDRKLFIVKEEFPDATIRGKRTYHYLIALNKEEVKEIIPGLINILAESNAMYESLMPDKEDLQEFEKRLDKLFEATGDIEAEIWIGKNDLYLYKYRAVFELDLAEFFELDLAEFFGETKIALSIDVDLSNFDQPVKIEAPEKHKALEDIFVPMDLFKFNDSFYQDPAYDFPYDFDDSYDFPYDFYDSYDLPFEKPFMLKDVPAYLPASILNFLFFRIF